MSGMRRIAEQVEKKDLAEYKRDKYGLIFFELGFKVK